jgi:tRNA-dependent cyclodipeptide synthase
MRTFDLRPSAFPNGSNISDRDRRALVGISLNGKKILATDLLTQVFEWTDNNVGEFDLLIGDYLNRYNYQAFEGSSPNVAIEKATNAGKEASSRLREIITQSTIHSHVSMISSAKVTEGEDFLARSSHFFRCYSENENFRRAIDSGVDKFLGRSHPQLLKNVKIRDFCVAYQLEELVLFEQLANKGYGVLVYPGAQLPVMKAIVSKTMSGVSPAIERLTLVELSVLEDKQP